MASCNAALRVVSTMTLATIGNIETSASMSAVLETDSEYDDNGKAQCPWDQNDWFMSFPIARRMMMSLPAGAKLKQYSSAQPNSQYDTFCRSLIREIARCTGMPYNVAAGDSSSYNYSSGRLDHQSFYLSNRVELTDIECECVERVFERWIRIRASKASGSLQKTSTFRCTSMPGSGMALSTSTRSRKPMRPMCV